MSDDLELYYRQAQEFGREIVTLIKVAEANGTDQDGHVIRGQIRQRVSEWETDSSPLRVWLLIEVLARSVAATYEDLDDWSVSVLQAVAEDEEGGR